MFLVIGATGQVGRAVVADLCARGLKVRALSRTPESAGLPPEVETVAGDVTDPASVEPALDGVSKVYLTAGPDSGRSVSALAASAGIEHLVLLSSQAVHLPRENSVADKHAAAEEAVRASGVPWTFLRPGSFSSNALQWAGTIRDEGVVYAPYPDVTTAPADPADLGAVAAATLASDAYAGAVLELTGPASVTQWEQVEILSELLHRRIRLEAVPPEVMREAMAQQLGRKTADDLLEVMAHGDGKDTGPLPTVEQVTGRAPRGFREWAAGHLDAFR